jgi:RNase H-fold protein (predicted Holliday junction resolvase)
MDKGIAGYDENSSKRAFGINIRNSKFPLKGESRKKAFEEIKKDLKKSKAEKAIEGLKKSIDSGKHDTTHKLDEVKEALEEDTKATKDADHGHDGH